MHLEANQPEFSPSIVSQVELDTLLALKKAKSLRQIVEVRQLRCINHQLESETDFGKQIWFLKRSEWIRSRKNFNVTVFFTIAWSFHYLN